jgi:O-antigen/teichoic acid export membrane protein
MQIGKRDVIWNFIATFMRIASGIIVLPLVLRLLPTQEVGLWNIFITIGSLATLLDFGFSNAFTRKNTESQRIFNST